MHVITDTSRQCLTLSWMQLSIADIVCLVKNGDNVGWNKTMWHLVESFYHLDNCNDPVHSCIIG